MGVSRWSSPYKPLAKTRSDQRTFIVAVPVLAAVTSALQRRVHGVEDAGDGGLFSLSCWEDATNRLAKCIVR